MPKSRIVLLVVAIGAWLVAATAPAAEPLSPAAALSEVGRGRVAAVEPGPVLRLEDGRRVRPALILAPPPLPGAARADWSPAADLDRAVAGLLAGQVVSLHWPAVQHDRHGRQVAHVLRAADGLWLQGAVVGQGVALVMPFVDEEAAAPALLAVEARARADGRGLWRDPQFAVRRAATVAATPGALRLVAGRVKAVAEVRGTVYLNFGDDWRHDFTAMLDDALARTCAGGGLDVLALTGRRLRLRGWLRRYNGPLIEVTACHQIEVLVDGDD